MRKSTANAIKTLLLMDRTVTRDERQAVMIAMQKDAVVPDPRKDMTIAEAADYLGISRTTLWRLCASGKVAADRRGKKFYVKAAAIATLKKEVA